MKTRTDLHAGECPGGWQYGLVEQASGGGYYGAVRGVEDGQSRYFNNGYTQFCPNREGVQVGQRVIYSLFVPPNERAGKIACIASSAE